MRRTCVLHIFLTSEVSEQYISTTRKILLFNIPKPCLLVRLDASLVEVHDITACTSPTPSRPCTCIPAQQVEAFSDLQKQGQADSETIFTAYSSNLLGLKVILKPLGTKLSSKAAV
jgi:hypothetical protein